MCAVIWRAEKRSHEISTTDSKLRSTGSRSLFDKFWIVSSHASSFICGKKLMKRCLSEVSTRTNNLSTLDPVILFQKASGSRATFSSIIYRSEYVKWRKPQKCSAFRPLPPRTLSWIIYEGTFLSAVTFQCAIGEQLNASFIHCARCKHSHMAYDGKSNQIQFLIFMYSLRMLEMLIHLNDNVIQPSEIHKYWFKLLLLSLGGVIRKIGLCYVAEKFFLIFFKSVNELVMIKINDKAKFWDIRNEKWKKNRSH